MFPDASNVWSNIRSTSEKLPTPNRQQHHTSLSHHAYPIARKLKTVMNRDQPLDGDESTIHSQSHFVEGVAHDLNNLIAATAGVATLILSNPERHAHVYAERILAASRMSGLLVERLIHPHERHETAGAHNVSDVIDEILTLIELGSGKKTKVHVSIDEAIKDYQIDVADLQQLIMNLSINARHALRANKTNPELTIKINHAPEEFAERQPDFGSTTREQKYLCLEVSDNGAGMDEATRRNVLKPYFTTKKELGTGIGLVIVSNIAKSYDGAIFIDSEPGRGTQFSVLWPI